MKIEGLAEKKVNVKKVGHKKKGGEHEQEEGGSMREK